MYFTNLSVIMFELDSYEKKKNRFGFETHPLFKYLFLFLLKKNSGKEIKAFSFG